MKKVKNIYHISISIHSEPICVKTKVSFKIVFLNDFQVTFPNSTTKNGYFNYKLYLDEENNNFIPNTFFNIGVLFVVAYFP